MPIYTQGEDYEEDEEVAPKPQAASRRAASEPEPEPQEDSDDVVEEVPKRKRQPAKTTKRKSSGGGGMSINPKLIAVGVACVVAVGIVVVIMASVSASKKAKAEEKAREQQIELAQQDIDFRNQHPELFETESSGEEDTSAEQVEQAMTSEQLMPYATQTYSEKELAALRKWGFTANQLEVAARDGISATGLVEQAKKDREEANKEALEAVSDTASPEYQKLLHETWLGGDPLDVSAFQTGVMHDSATYRENVDYEKLESRGTQLWILAHLNDGRDAFLHVSPGRYNELPDTGNMVVEYTYAYTGVDDQYVITSIKEVEIGQ